MPDGNRKPAPQEPLKVQPVSSLSIDKQAGKLDQELEAQMEAELDAFIQQEKAELGIVDREHFRDVVHDKFTAGQRAHTTIFFTGLAHAHDLLINAALRGLGYKIYPLEVPDYESFRVGKEYGNRGQCSPTYFTVGNLVKTLQRLEQEGLSKEQINERYLYLTVGACGPCRFGSYITEYRKALRDAGFGGFRVILFQQKGGYDQTEGNGIDDEVMAGAVRAEDAGAVRAEDAGGVRAVDASAEGMLESGLDLNAAFFFRFIIGGMLGDVLNGLMYRIRPYEVVAGATDRVVQQAKDMLTDVLQTPDSLHKLPLTMLKIRRMFGAIEVDRTVIKPKVAIIGEFWAMTTEGDGNYKMPSFLESEGAEVEVQFVTAWLLYNMWEIKWDTLRRMRLEGADEGLWGLADNDNPGKTVWGVMAADKIFRGMFQILANTLGLHGYKLPDMDELSDLTKDLYHDEIRGGEGHMEVGKLIVNTTHDKVNMTLSVKPFGCMPSSGVSDGVQTVVQAKFPDAIFLPIETNGDGAVNVYSRVQMMLHKARQQARRQTESALQEHGVELDEVRAFIGRHPLLKRALTYPSHTVGCTAANAVQDAGRWLGRIKKVRARVGRVVPALA